jgi:hypothetical protein
MKGESGVSKSQIIKAIIANINLICYKEEVILIALIGVAADNTSSNTYYVTLSISIAKMLKIIISSCIKKL